MPTVMLAGNLEMYYDDDDYTDPWRIPETIVLHHGNAKNGRLWYAWVPLLSRQYRVIRLDARGFGRSTVPPAGYDWSLSGFASDLLGLLDHLELDKVHLVGETVGGTVALQFAYEHPERLHTVTTCTSPYKFVGAPQYLENYNLIQEQGIEEWVRRSADRRITPKPCHCCPQSVVCGTDDAGVTPGGDGDPGLPGQPGPDPDFAGDQYPGPRPGGVGQRHQHPRPGRRHGGPDAQLPARGHPQRHGIRAAL